MKGGEKKCKDAKDHKKDVEREQDCTTRETNISKIYLALIYTICALILENGSPELTRIFIELIKEIIK